MLGFKKLFEKEKDDSDSRQYELESLQTGVSDLEKDALVMDKTKVSFTLSFSYHSFKPKASQPIPIKNPRQKVLLQPESELDAEISSSLPMRVSVKNNKDEWCATSYQQHSTPVDSLDNFDGFYVGSPQGEAREKYRKNFFRK